MKIENFAQVQNLMAELENVTSFEATIEDQATFIVPTQYATGRLGTTLQAFSNSSKETLKNQVATLKETIISEIDQL